MEAAGYRVVLSGKLSDGHTIEQVAGELAGLFKLPAGQVARLLSGRPTPIKKVFSRDQADKVRTRILSAGAACYIEPVPKEPTKFSLADDAATPAPIARATGTAPGDGGFRCPKCGKAQPSGDICIACGVVFAKLRSEPTPRPAPETDTAEVPRERLWALYADRNAERYLRRFTRYRTSGFSPGWNWSAFFAAPLWMLYRKMWLTAIAGFISGWLLPLISNIVWGVFADYLYFRQAEGAIRRHLESGAAGDELESAVAASGGTSAKAAYLAIAASLVFGFYINLRIGTALMEAAEEAQNDAARHGERLPAAVTSTPEGGQTQIRMTALGLSITLFAATDPDTVADADMAAITKRLQLDPSMTRDAWGTEFRFSTNAGRYQLTSAGPDRTFATEDDLVMNRELPAARGM